MWSLYLLIWQTHNINMASDSAHLPVTPCSSESYCHNHKACTIVSLARNDVYTVVVLMWLNSARTGSERSFLASLQHHDVHYIHWDMERIKEEERAAGWDSRERSLWEAGCKHMPNSVSGSLSLSLIPSLIHQRLGQSFEAGHSAWSLGPNLSPRPVRSPPQTAPAGCQRRSGRLSLLQRDS